MSSTIAVMKVEERAARDAVVMPPNVKVADTRVLTPALKPVWKLPQRLQYTPTIHLEVLPLLKPEEEEEEDTVEEEELPPVELPWRVFCEPLRIDLLHATVKWQRSINRAFATATKGRGDKRGSTRKIAAQKGRGAARVGQNRAPGRRGGGKAQGRHAHSYATEMTKKKRMLGLRVALSQKLREGLLTVVDTLVLPQTKTKVVVDAMEDHEWKNVLFVHDCIGDMALLKEVKKLRNLELRKQSLHDLYGELDVNEAWYKSHRNIQKTRTRSARNVHVYDILKYEHLVLTERAALTLAERLAPKVYTPLSRVPGAKYVDSEEQ